MPKTDFTYTMSDPTGDLSELYSRVQIDRALRKNGRVQFPAGRPVDSQALDVLLLHLCSQYWKTNRKIPVMF